MNAPRLSDIKKELQRLPPEAIAELCIRLAKYRKENKEFLSYLLFDSSDPFAYAASVKELLAPSFKTLSRQSFKNAKEFRKILKGIAKHTKFIGIPEVEIDLLLWFCHRYLEYADGRSTYKPLHTLFIRQLEKMQKLMSKLHEDLRFDYEKEYTALLEEASSRLRWLNQKQFQL